MANLTLAKIVANSETAVRTSEEVAGLINAIKTTDQTAIVITVKAARALGIEEIIAETEIAEDMTEARATKIKTKEITNTTITQDQTAYEDVAGNSLTNKTAITTLSTKTKVGTTRSNIKTIKSLISGCTDMVRTSTRHLRTA